MLTLCEMNKNILAQQLYSTLKQISISIIDDFAMESQVIVRIVIVGPSVRGLRCSCVSGESCIFLCFRGVLCILETFCKRVPEQPGQQQDPAQPTPANENIWIFEEKR